jgi:Cu(I)/Ag(I) efflux system membrane protein CusA/SilA
LRQSFASWVFLWHRQSGPKGDLVDDEFGRVVQVPGWTNIFTQPIIARIEMLSSGVRTDIGVKVFGPDLDTIDRVCKDVEGVLKPINGARAVVANPIMGKGYLEIDIDLGKAARYGVSVEDIKNTVEVALGGQAITQTVEGRERFPVRLRYPRSEREDEDTVRRLLVSGGEPSRDRQGAEPSRSLMVAAQQNSFSDDSRRPHKTIAEHGGSAMQPLQIPLGSVADVRIVEGPAVMKSENGQLVNYVTLMVQGRAIVGFVEEAQRAVAEKVQLPEGVHIEWSGEFEHQVRAARTLRFVFPAVIVLIFVILYLTYRDLADAGLMMLAVPEALAGGAFFQFLFPKILHGWSAPPMDFSVAVWVGYIACFGMATETGIIMLVYLREAIQKRGGLENIQSLEELRQAVIEGAVHRLRPKLLTEGVAIIAIAPMLWATGVGAEVIAPMAVPVLGGLLISDEVVDIFLPVRFYWVRRSRWLKMQEQKAGAPALSPVDSPANGVHELVVESKECLAP